MGIEREAALRPRELWLNMASLSVLNPQPVVKDLSLPNPIINQELRDENEISCPLFLRD